MPLRATGSRPDHGGPKERQCRPVRRAFSLDNERRRASYPSGRLAAPARRASSSAGPSATVKPTASAQRLSTMASASATPKSPETMSGQRNAARSRCRASPGPGRTRQLHEPQFKLVQRGQHFNHGVQSGLCSRAVEPHAQPRGLPPVEGQVQDLQKRSLRQPGGMELQAVASTVHRGLPSGDCILGGQRGHQEGAVVMEVGRRLGPVEARRSDKQAARRGQPAKALSGQPLPHQDDGAMRQFEGSQSQRYQDLRCRGEGHARLTAIMLAGPGGSSASGHSCSGSAAAAPQVERRGGIRVSAPAPSRSHAPRHSSTDGRRR
jgi:hypothetical protein